MSTVAARFQNQIVTVFPGVTRDEYGDATGADSPIEIRCEYAAGTKLVRDDTGTEFVPDYVVYTTDSRVEGLRGMPIYFAPLAEALTVKAYRIRTVREYPSLPSQGGKDYVIYV